MPHEPNYVLSRKDFPDDDNLASVTLSITLLSKISTATSVIDLYPIWAL